MKTAKTRHDLSFQYKKKLLDFRPNMSKEKVCTRSGQEKGVIQNLVSSLKSHVASLSGVWSRAGGYSPVRDQPAACLVQI